MVTKLIAGSSTARLPLESGGSLMIQKKLQKTWMHLQGKKPHMAHFLAQLRLTGIRGIQDLRVALDYPVSVIAGENGCGKSTVLTAAACAYRVPGAGRRDFVPSSLFPDYRPKHGAYADRESKARIDFDYATPQGYEAMRWSRTKGWTRSFRGRKNATQPERSVYLRTLSNLGDPSDVRGVLSMSRAKSAPQEIPMTAAQIHFAEGILPFRYSGVVDLTGSGKRLLFANQKTGPSYSELHMAAGERAVLRLAKEIAHLDGALVLIDDVEAGLHPWSQQLLMLHLQELALCNDLQVIVTSHSPTVLDSVPQHARIFLERDSCGAVRARPAYQDVIQNALYGRSGNALNILCEDEASEGIVQGVLDFLLPALHVNPQSVRIGSDAGGGEFPTHAATFRKFGQIDSFVFVLDGDKTATPLAENIQRAAGIDVPVFFLPGSEGPEAWVWNRLRTLSADDFSGPGIASSELYTEMDRLDAVYAPASDGPTEIAEAKLNGLSEILDRQLPDLCRAVARVEAERRASDLKPLVESLSSALQDWRESHQ